MENDARSWSQQEQQRVRHLAVKSVKEGMTYIKAAEHYGVSPSCIGNWIRRDKDDPKKGLISNKRGRRQKEQLRLNDKAQKRIIKLITDKDPNQLKLPGFLWTRDSVRTLIKKETGVSLGLTSTGNYLRKWGFTPQKPAKRAIEQDTSEVIKFKEEIYPKVVKAAKKDNAVIFWGDEMGIRSDDQRGRSWSKRGNTPIIKKTGNRFSINVISAVSNLGKLYFSIHRGRFNSDKFIDFLDKLQKQLSGRKVYLIVDNHSIHKSKKVKSYIYDNKDTICLIYLPKYSPEINPNELLNQDTKLNIHSKQRPLPKKNWPQPQEHIYESVNTNLKSSWDSSKEGM